MRSDQDWFNLSLLGYSYEGKKKKTGRARRAPVLTPILLPKRPLADQKIIGCQRKPEKILKARYN